MGDAELTIWADNSRPSPRGPSRRKHEVPGVGRVCVAMTGPPRASCHILTGAPEKERAPTNRRHFSGRHRVGGCLAESSPVPFKA